jgi:hypothetical protein
MIIIDMNQVMIANLMVQIGRHTNAKLEEKMLRYMVLNSLRSLKRKFYDSYGQIIIACEGPNCWRKQVFPYYKANRKKRNQESELDWKTIYVSMNKIVSEIKEVFPYKVVKVETAEADDIIASLVRKVRVQDKSDEPILILSGDKDFIQLHVYKNVEQYDPVRKKWIKDANPKTFLAEHILRGDFGDGIPNVLSSDNCFVIGEKQASLTRKRIENIMKTNSDDYDVIMKRNFLRNQQLIDLSQIPESVYEKIVEEFEKNSNHDRSKLLNYFIENKLTNLTEYISEF